MHTSNIYCHALPYTVAMDLRQLRYFVTVVQEGSVSRAAAQLSMTQPPLSTAIAQLERELGVRLLDRHARGVDATVAGEHLARQGAHLLAQVEELTARVHGIGTGRLGSLTIATSSAIDWEILPGLLATFDRHSPDVQTELVAAAEPDVLDRVRDRRADVGAVYCTRSSHLERLRGRDLESALIRREPLVAVVPEHSPFADLESLELATLQAEPWLLPATYPAFPGLATHVRDAWQQAGIMPRACRTVADQHTLVRLVAAGMGVGLVPAAVRSLGSVGVRAIRLSQPISPVEAAVIWRRDERPSPVLARFLRAALSTREPDQLGPAFGRSPSTAGGRSAEA